MNNTMDFVRNFNSDNYALLITNFFDEIMVLYNLVGDRNDLEICTDADATVATFTMLMESDKDAQQLYNTLHNSEFEVYGNKFDIVMKLYDSSIKTSIIKRL